MYNSPLVPSPPNHAPNPKVSYPEAPVTPIPPPTTVNLDPGLVVPIPTLVPSNIKLLDPANTPELL